MTMRVLAIVAAAVLVAALSLASQDWRQGTGSAQTSYSLLVSPFADRSGSVALDGVTIDGSVAIFISPESGIKRVQFFLDGAWHQTERIVPYDFHGTAGNGKAKLYDTSQIADGLHVISAEIDTSGGTEMVSATLTVANDAPPPTPAPTPTPAVTPAPTLTPTPAPTPTPTPTQTLTLCSDDGIAVTVTLDGALPAGTPWAVLFLEWPDGTLASAEICP